MNATREKTVQKTTEAIWLDYSNRILKFIQHRVQDPVVAEDIRQDVFLKIFERIDSLRNSEKLHSWMYQIARNAIVDYYRANSKDEILSANLEPAPDITDLQTRQEMAGWLEPVISLLPDTYREAVRLSEIEGWSHQQVADHQKITLSAAKSRVRRGKLLVKEILTDCCQFDFDQRGRVIDYHRRTDSCSPFRC
jgi:RNA polymerase sigma-70 factor, ECF subfamily